MITCGAWIGDDRCGSRIVGIVWGKLYPQDALGPRCQDCMHRQLGKTPWQLARNAEAVYWVKPALAEVYRRAVNAPPPGPCDPWEALRAARDLINGGDREAAVQLIERALGNDC